MTVPYLVRPDGARLAYHKTGGAAGAIMFLGGFRSDMTGSKATFLEARCRAKGKAFLRFDYRGHGASDGDFASLTLSDWLDDALFALDRLTEGPVILAGSSMGGWLALRAARERPGRICGLLGIAAAPDFTRWMQAGMTPAQKAQLAAQGYIEVPGEYGGAPYRITRALLDDGERHCLLDRKLPLGCPVHLLQGQRDPDVPWQTANRIRDALGGAAEITFIPDGDHRLSRPEDLELIWRALETLATRCFSGADRA